MITYAKRALYIALAGAGALAAADAAQAVNVSADRRGQVLLYPYYTTRADSAGNAYGTLVSVVNDSALAKAVRVRFLEGKNSREVLGFNLFLSPFDAWTAAVLPDTTTGGAKIGTVDASCTLPAFSGSPTAPYVPFVNFAYTAPDDDGAGSGLDRTKEGYFEIIEMAAYASTSTTGKAVTHVNGVAPCGANVSHTQAALDAQAPTGGLFGTATFINVNSGTDYTADAVALANFYRIGANYQALGTALPDLTQATPPVSSIQGPNGKLYESLWSIGSADPVSAVLMHESLINEFVLDSGTLSQTDWVVTMPTKRHYVGAGSGNATRLFQRNFDGSAGSCDDVVLSLYDRDERATMQPEIDPLLGGYRPPFPSLCWAANVVTFNASGAASSVFGSTNVAANLNSPFQNGWLNLSFPSGLAGADATMHRLINNGGTSISGGGAPTTTGTTTFTGLPAIGFAAVSFTNGTLVVGSQNVLSNYGGSFAHKTNTLIQ